MAAHLRPKQPWEKPVKAEEKARLARQATTDMTIRPEDLRPAPPMQLNDPLRPNELSEAFLTYLTGQSARTGRMQRLHRILRELKASNLRVSDVRVFDILATHFRFRSSQRDTAGMLVTSQPTVQRGLKIGITWVETRWLELVRTEGT